MRFPRLSTIIAAFPLLLLSSCAGTPERTAPEAVQPVEPSAAVQVSPDSGPAAEPAAVPEPLPAIREKPTRFLPGPVELPSIPSSVGALSADVAEPASRRASLSAAFREAYQEAVLRGDPLRGTLGGDLIHLWKPPARKNDPSDRGGAFVQNWRGAAGGRANSWGLSGLVLACCPAAGSRVVLVKGAILDAYGRGLGIGGANGVAGYGAPLGDEFPLPEGLAQRFERGLLLAGRDGGYTFTPGEPPSAAGVPEAVGRVEAGTGGALPFSSAEAAAFRAAWIAAVNSGRTAADADGAVSLSSGTEWKAWIQTFGEGLWGIALPADTARTGGRAKILDRPFLESVRSADGLAFDFGDCGLPLTDSFHNGELWMQIFQRGRMEALSETSAPADAPAEIPATAQ
jgi:hypothetical protein